MKWIKAGATKSNTAIIKQTTANNPGQNKEKSTTAGDAQVRTRGRNWTFELNMC